MIGQAGEDYLKSIYLLHQQYGMATPARVAEHLEVSAAAVTKMGRRLQELKLLRYDRRKGFVLTDEGTQIALEIIRHHRLIELYLQKALGYTWDEVHDEAEILEHVISEAFEEKIDALLGHPTHDPHGDPIPSKDGEIVHVDYPTLEEMEQGETGSIQRVSNHDASMLRYMSEQGLVPGANIEVLEQEPYGGSIHLNVDNHPKSVGRQLAVHIFVDVDEKA